MRCFMADKRNDDEDAVVLLLLVDESDIKVITVNGEGQGKARVMVPVLLSPDTMRGV